jgi:hypothetical protein
MISDVLNEKGILETGSVSVLGRKGGRHLHSSVQYTEIVSVTEIWFRHNP